MSGKSAIALILVPVVLCSGIGAIAVFGSAPNQNCGPGGALAPGLINGPVAGFSAEQLANAAQIMLAAQSLGLSARDQQIGIMTALGESSLRVLDYGDGAGPDSRGLFQQRDNGSWGSYADRMDPYRSALNFFRVLATIGNRGSMTPTEVAHAVQRNQDPNHYTKYWDSAGQILAALSSAGSRYDLGPVKPQTSALADLLGPMFKITTVGGWRASDPYPDHPSGLAADFMVTSRAVGDALAAYAAQNADRLGIEYILWNQQSWYPGQGWRAMEDRGSITANHVDHVHITLRADATVQGPSTQTCNTSGGPVAPVSREGWAMPAAGPLTSPFGARQDPTGAMGGGIVQHSGIDLAPGCYQPIYAARTGVVGQAGPAAGFGNWIVLDHGSGLTTVYGHMYADGVLVRPGQNVTAGEIIARVGSAGDSTGCHLHFEIRSGGQAIDPAQYLPINAV